MARQSATGCGIWLAFVWLSAAAGCGSSSKREPVVLAKTEPDNGEGDSGVRQDLTDKIAEDERRAADVINNAIEGKYGEELSHWAAVYASRLGLKRDEEAAKNALVRGAASDDPLLGALCWRWLGSLNIRTLPKWSKTGGEDPVVEVMAALAYANLGRSPKELENALAEPEGRPGGPDMRALAKERVERLLALVAPFDNGPLALAVAFAEARRAEWAEKSEGKEVVWVSGRLRKELAGLVLGDRGQAIRLVELSKPGPRGTFTILSQRLETTLVKQSRDVLRSIAVTGGAELQKDALRAIAIVAKRPIAEDFGAVAAALGSADPGVRLEAARTFLLLGLRARAP